MHSILRHIILGEAKVTVAMLQLLLLLAEQAGPLHVEGLGMLHIESAINVVPASFWISNCGMLEESRMVRTEAGSPNKIITHTSFLFRKGTQITRHRQGRLLNSTNIPSTAILSLLVKLS
jgi:hypothetical protein